MVEIDKGDDNQNRDENKYDRVDRRRTVFKEERTGEKRSQELDKWIPGGDNLLAISAFSPEKKIADDREVIPVTDRMTAVGTARRGRDNGEGFRNPADADVKEASHRSAREGEDNHGPYRGIHKERLHKITRIEFWDDD
jgi:hypothetical protein